jgi:hypothetical protein
MAQKTTEQDLSGFRQVHKVEVKKEHHFKMTKKIAALIIIVVVLIACCITGYILTKDSDGYSVKVSNNKNIVTGDVTISKQQYFEHLLSSSGAQETVDEAYNKIVNKLIPTSKYQKQIDALVKSKEKTYTSYMGSLKSYATSMCYSSVKAFEQDSVIPDAKQDLLKQKFFTDHYSAQVKKYKVAYIKAITVSKESTAIKLIKQATTEKKFNKLMKSSKYKSNSTDYSMVTTKTSTSTLNKYIKAKLSTFSNMTKDGVYASAIKQSSSKYVVVYVYNTDKTANKSKIVKALSDLSDTDKDVEAYYLKKYNFTVYDDKLKKAIKKINKNYIND